MAPRSHLPPKIYQIQLKTHKLTVCLTVPPTTSIDSLKSDVLDALTSDVVHPEGVLDSMPDDDDLGIPPPESDGIPRISSVKDFELVKAHKDRGRSTGAYETLDPAKQVRDYGFGAWEVLFVQFRDPDTGTLLPVTYVLPSIEDEDEEMQSVAPSEGDAYSTPVSNNKGKRKVAEVDE
ncbi:hypothetical protein BDQ12DRAFT_200511 [Crucibulum laeve]|uniref:Uncharacterized protein n=1 Tax=Crucibulum laeve TaxID=68775 RepID=A0A5C3MEP8_9AGAR|nr:hypothetical protein BDQ12DRAFT_200511 [Crucibulum laeve]